MRAALSTIQQTLTPEAASVLNHSIAEAGRRNHGQTTPLHVAATLLASPSGFLRQACIRSHPNSSHPLQCRALELCFSVALDRLPTAQTAAAEPPISNALLAALKRAQTNQRRGCPEQQQQPMLAVKVELEQLIVSILDDPSVSRVMREASFSSPAVKATIEQSLNASAAPPHHVAGGNPNFGTIGGRMIPNPSPSLSRNIYLNPRLHQAAAAAAQIGNQKADEMTKMLEIMVRTKKRNPILVGDSEPEAMVKEFLTRIQNRELENDGILKNVHVISIEKSLLSDKNLIAVKIDELGELIRSRIRSGGVVLDLGDLKWLVEHPVNAGGAQQKQQLVSELGRVAVAEMAKLVARFAGGDDANEANKLWLIGNATCETYLRCQVYHSTMENDWDLQAIPVTSPSPFSGAFPRLGADRLVGGSLNILNSWKAVTPPMPGLTRRLSENLDPLTTLCPQCSENHDKEAAKLAAIEKSFTAKQEPNRSSMPRWLQSGELSNTDPKVTDEVWGKDQGVLSKVKSRELQKKWRDTCLHLHPNFHQNNGSDRAGPPALSMPSLYNSNLLMHAPFQPKPLTVKPLGEALKLNMTPVTAEDEGANGPPGSPVRTDLVLGRKDPDSVPENQAKDLLGCISSEPMTKLLEKFSNASDTDTYKKLLKGLMENSWWQAEAASAVASAITRCRLGNGKRRAGSRGDIWLLFTGPDRVAKKKMGSVLAEQICGSNPVTICLGGRRDEEEVDVNFRGKTAVDRIAEAVRRSPFSVIMLEDIDEADILVRGSIKRAVERGRLTDSHGREVGLGNAIFIVTGDWSTTNPEALRDGRFVDDKKLASAASGGWQLGLTVREKSTKRRANWSSGDEDRPLKSRKETAPRLSLDLNLAMACTDNDRPDGSHISSDLTVEDELGLVSRYFSVTSVPHELLSNVDDSIVFKPVDSSFVRREIRKAIAVKFCMAVDENLSIEVEDDVVEKILGGLWHDRTSLEEWVDKVLTPSFDQLKARLPTSDRSSLIARLVVESSFSDHGKSNGNADWLPSSIMV